MLEQSQQTSNIFDKYKSYIIKRLESQIEQYKECSGSWVFFNRIGNLLINLISWIIIASFVYIWWKARGMPITCDRISPEFCNSCFIYGKQLGTNLLNSTNISEILGGLLG